MSFLGDLEDFAPSEDYGRIRLSFSEAFSSSGLMNSVRSFSAALRKSLSGQMRTSLSFAGSKAFFRFKALANCRQSAEGRLCLIAVLL